MKTKTIAILIIITGFLNACTDLSEEIFSEITIDNFFRNEQELVANAGRAYTKLQGYVSEQSQWTLLLQASDECAVPTTVTGSWYSSGRYQQVQLNSIDPANRLVERGWNWIFNSIAACNEVIYSTELSTIEFEGKDKIIAELKILRAYFYYMAMDGWANIPFSVDFTDTSYPVQKDRAFVFDFIVSEILDNIDDLDEVPALNNYGRVTQGMAYSFLAKMYLNANEWIGVEMWEEAEAACEAVINKGHYMIENNYVTNFDVYNEVSKENIFVIVFSSVYTGGSSSNSFYLHTLTLEAASMKTFNIAYTPWSGFLAQPDFFESYDAADTRRSDTWLYGPQYDINGNLLFDGDGVQVIYEPVFDESKYFQGVGREKYDGARCWKWRYQTDGMLTSYRVSQENDFVLFRYADVILMYAEALMRQNRTSEIINNADFQKIRTRAGLAPYTLGELTLDELLAERGREFAWEGHRRQDLIRFGKFNEPWWAKATDPGHKIFPIPATALNSNPNLTQNPGY